MVKAFKQLFSGLDTGDAAVGEEFGDGKGAALLQQLFGELVTQREG